MLIVSTQCFPPIIGGIEDLVYNLCLALNNSGHKLIVFADGNGAMDESRFDREQPFAINRYSGLKPLRRRKKAADILALTKKTKARGIITDSWKSLEHLDPSLFNTVLCLVHGMEIPAYPAKKKQRRICSTFEKATAIIANSNYTAERAKRYIVQARRLHIVHPGINSAARPTADQIKKYLGAGRTPVLITLARLEKRKGHKKVLEILPRLINDFPDILYVIAGDGSERQNLEETVRHLRLVNNVLFTGFCDTEKKAAYLSGSDIFVMPGDIRGNDLEGFGIAYIEAAWFGVPSVAGDSGGAKEAVIHGETGLVCQTEDADNLYQSINSLLSNDHYRRQLGQNAENRANELLWGNIINRYEELLGI